MRVCFCAPTVQTIVRYDRYKICGREVAQGKALLIMNMNMGRENIYDCVRRGSIFLPEMEEGE